MINPRFSKWNRQTARALTLSLIVILGLGAVALTLALFGRFRPALAGSICVKPGGGDGCEATITDALAMAMEGDLIQVAAGTYSEYVQITQTLTLQGGWAPDFSVRDLTQYTSTIKPPINMVNPQSVVSILGQPADTGAVVPTLDGFEITGGRADLGSNHGGGLRIINSNAVVVSNTIHDNRAFLLGGGVWVQNGAPHLENNRILNNLSDGLGQDAYGGGMQLENAQGTLVGNFIAQNVVSGTQAYGGGIDIGPGGPVILRDNTIISNTATSGLSTGAGGLGEGGGVSTRGVNLSLDGDVISGNVALTDGGGLYIAGTLTATNATIAYNAASVSRGGGIYLEDPFGNLHLTNTTLSGNQADSHGGAIYFDAVVQSVLRLSGREMLPRQAVAHGAGSGGRFWLENSTFRENASGGDGGGISISGAVLTATNTIFESNQAVGSGGAVDARYSRMALLDSALTGNYGGDGGALYLSVDQISLIHNSVISGNTADFNAGALLNTATANMTITFSAIGGNLANDSAGAIENSGVLSIVESQIEDNSAGDDGGAILNANNGVVSLNDTKVRGNTAANFGGGFWNFQNAAIHIEGGEIFNNQASDGGGIYNRGLVTLQKTTVMSNSAINSGGGIFTDDVLVMTRTLVSSNQGDDGGGVFAEGGSVTGILTSTVRDNTTISGGGAGVNNNGALSVLGSTFSGNRTLAATGNGGGILNNDRVWMVNSTVSGNQAGGFGGGLRNGGAISLTNVTVHGNTGSLGAGGVQNMDTVTATNTILAANIPDNCGDAITSLGHNLEDADTCGLDPLQNDLIGLNPDLGPLAGNGGDTQTHAMLAGSPAIDAADDGACPFNDQRGVTRPIDGDGDMQANCDIGAYEFGAQLPWLYLPIIQRN